nr:transposase domain-containing protein [Pseudomonas mosselii]
MRRASDAATESPLRAVQAETTKVNGQEPYTWLRHVMERLPIL